MNLMKAFLAMNLISKFVSLVNSHFFTLKLVLLCYYKCSSKQCNHVYFVVLCARERIGDPLLYSSASLVSQLVKNQPAIQETWV